MHHLLTFSCKLTNADNWQPICSESKYGTHYLIYARFVVAETNDLTKKEIRKIELHLQNFTGAVTLGIAEAKFMGIAETADGTTEMNILKIKVKALFYNPSTTVDIPKGEMILNEKDQMETIVSVIENHDVNILDSKNAETINRARFVDEEFYRRDGESILRLTDADKGPRNCRAIRSTFYF